MAAEKFSLSVTAIDKYRRGDSEPTRETLERIAKEARVSIEWLVLGNGEPSIRSDNSVQIPVFDIELAAGDGMWIERRVEIGVASIAADLLPFSSKQLSGYRVRGDSMHPKIPDKSVAIIEYSDDHSGVRNGGVYAYMHDDQLRIKFLLRQTTHLLVRSFNFELYPDEFVPFEIADNFQIIGKCKGVIAPI